MKNKDFQEIRGDSVLILGYSREGQATHRFLQAHYPNLHIDIADKKIWLEGIEEIENDLKTLKTLTKIK